MFIDLHRPIRSRLFASAAVLALTASAASAQTYIVTTAEDDGAGSLRAALGAAEATGGQIVLTTEDDIEIASTLVYAGTLPISIVGNGQTVSTDANTTLLAATQGADLSVTDLNFDGPGGFSIENRGDDMGDAGKGIFVDVRDDQTGTVTLNLMNVTVSNVANHGIHVSDCSLADDCGGGSGGSGEGSAASIAVHFSNVTIEDAGIGKFDADGLRVDERDAGNIVFTAVSSTFTGVGADGVELDEGQAGDVNVTVLGSVFSANGAYCDPEILAAFMPAEDEGEFEDGAVSEDAIPGPVVGSPDDACIEREVDLYDSGSVEEYAFGIDLDDGFDIDEAGAGSINATVVGSAIEDNLDEGLDFDEEDAGGINVTTIRTVASGNTDDGIKNSEEGAGGVTGILIDTVAEDNGGKGAVYEEEDEGDVMVEAYGSVTGNNDDSDNTGLEVVQDDDGMGNVMVKDSDIADGIDAEGVEVMVE